MLQCSLIIPSYNSASILPKILDALCTQTISTEAFEVILVDDGSTDDTAQVCASYADLLQLRYLHQHNQGQGNARNHGLQYARAPIVLFIQADTIAAPTLIEEHLRVHRQFPQEHIACLGFTTWDPAVGITPLMYFMEHGGHQFAYGKAAQHAHYLGSEFPALSYHFFYTSNISLKRSLLERQHFQPGFTKYGWEDIELGQRLDEKEGLVILYNAKASVLHHEHISMERWKMKMLSIGKNGVYFERMCPSVRVLPHGLKAGIFKLLAFPPHIWFWKVASMIVPNKKTYFMYYYSLMKRLTFQGMKIGAAELATTQKGLTM